MLCGSPCMHILYDNSTGIYCTFIPIYYCDKCMYVFIMNNTTVGNTVRTSTVRTLTHKSDTYVPNCDINLIHSALEILGIV